MVDMDSKQVLKGSIAAATMMFIFGVDAPIMKSVMPHWINAYGLITFRMCLAALLALILSLFMPREKVVGRDKWLLILAGLFGILLNQGGITIGVQYSSPIDVGLIVVLTPVLVIVFSRIFLKEKPSAKTLIGLGLGLVGVLLLLFLGGAAKDSTQKNTLIGNLVVLGGITSYALYLTFAGGVLRRYSVTTLMKWIFGFAALFSLPLGVVDLITSAAFTEVAPWSVYARMAFSSVGATFCAFMLNMIAMKHIRGSSIAMFGYLQPIITAIIAVAISQAHLTLINIISGILIGIGVYLSTQQIGGVDMKLSK